MKKILFALALVLGFSAILPMLQPKENTTGAWVLIVEPTVDCSGWNLHISTHGMTVTNVEPSEKGNWTFAKQTIHYVVDATSSDGDRHAEGDLSRPTEGCTPIPPPVPPTKTPCPKTGCVAIDPQQLSCVTWLAAPIAQLYDGKRELHGWWQAVDGSKVNLVIKDGHLRNSALHAVLKNGEKIDIEMRVGFFVEFKDEVGNQLWYQQNCLRHGANEGQPSSDVDVRFSQVQVNSVEPCVNKEES